MISPVIVEMRDGVATARCHSLDCGREPHLLFGGPSFRDAERAADVHLKTLNHRKKKKEKGTP